MLVWLVAVREQGIYFSLVEVLGASAAYTHANVLAEVVE